MIHGDGWKHCVEKDSETGSEEKMCVVISQQCLLSTCQGGGWGRVLSIVEGGVMVSRCPFPNLWHLGINYVTWQGEIKVADGLTLRWGDAADSLGGSNVITRILISERGRWGS